jgi:hypothetical protein
VQPKIRAFCVPRDQNHNKITAYMQGINPLKAWKILNNGEKRSQQTKHPFTKSRAG